MSTPTNTTPNANGFQVPPTSQAALGMTTKDLKDRDGFFQETYRIFDALGRHRKVVAGSAAVLIAACVVGGILANRHEARSEEGRNALFTAQKAYETELKTLAGIKTPAPEAPTDAAAEASTAETPAAKAAKEAKAAADKAKRADEEAGAKRAEELAFSPLDVDAKFPEGVKKYEEVISKFDGTRAAHEARMLLGTLYYSHGQNAKAAPLFQAASSSAPGSFEKALAFQSWGYSLENDGKFAEALAAYDKALGLGEGSIKGDVLLASARCHEAMHDSAKARSTYDQIASLLPNTDAAKSAEALKAKLQ